MSGALKGVEASEGLAEFVVGDPLIVDVDAVEDCLVEQATLLLVAASVQLTGVLQELQARFDQAGTVGEVVIRGVEALGEPVPLAFDLT
ncbi:hypothetical protein L1857_08450 [Amycolatopsis thermalba]|uniref:STAS domain-containing protein n=1 Tax=Amycolatopsis thermalba TaxID=944492 RepID=A0ABY4NS24_9PSEU|nr:MULTISPECIES: hypothetical protein [Amycolatopsis]UQS22843.1 hypothetical protein L1857_08450 [Amycolatopsis thermalba]